MTRLAVTLTHHAFARAVLLLLVVSVVAAAQNPTPRTDVPTDARSTAAKYKAGLAPIPVLGAGPTFGLGVHYPFFGVGNAAGDADRSVIVKQNGGASVRGSVMYAREWLGTDRTINSYEASLNQYMPVKQHTVIALRGSVCGAGNQSPVWQLCTFGVRNDLRGYTVGRYRVSLGARFGLAAFAGYGEVASSWSDVTTGNVLKSGGPGIRYGLSRSHGLNLGVDYAFATRGGAYYFRMREPF